MTRLLTVCLLGFVLLGTASSGLSVADEKEKEPRRLETVEGTIKAVDPAGNTFILALLDGKKPAGYEIKFTFDQKTNFWLDGKPSTMDNAMKVGNTAIVMHLNSMAMKVEVRSKPA